MPRHSLSILLFCGFVCILLQVVSLWNEKRLPTAGTQALDSAKAGLNPLPTIHAYVKEFGISFVLPVGWSLDETNALKLHEIKLIPPAEVYAPGYDFHTGNTIYIADKYAMVMATSSAPEQYASLYFEPFQSYLHNLRPVEMEENIRIAQEMRFGPTGSYFGFVRDGGTGNVVGLRMHDCDSSPKLQCFVVFSQLVSSIQFSKVAGAI